MYNRWEEGGGGGRAEPAEWTCLLSRTGRQTIRWLRRQGRRQKRGHTVTHCYTLTCYTPPTRSRGTTRGDTRTPPCLDVKILMESWRRAAHAAVSPQKPPTWTSLVWLWQTRHTCLTPVYEQERANTVTEGEQEGEYCYLMYSGQTMSK